MKVKRLHLQNYGRFDDLNIDFAPTAEKTGNVTVIVGNNGAGKSQILQALATGLSWFVEKLSDENADGVELTQSDIKNNKHLSSVKVCIEDFSSIEKNKKWVEENIQADWKIDATTEKKFRPATYGLRVNRLSKVIRSYIHKFKNNEEVSLPIFAYYSVDRNIRNMAVEVRDNHINNQFAAYDDALKKTVNFDSFFSWFREREDIENEKRANSAKSDENQDESALIKSLKSKFEYPIGEGGKTLTKEELDPFMLNFITEFRMSFFSQLNKVDDRLLSSVRKSIGFFTSFENVHIRRQGTPTMIVEKDGEELDVNQLSQGEKSLLALVGDIARRLALLNPSLDNPLEGEGVVMIDEMDLHLHPKWQHDLIDKFVKTFPNVQFILTTHSPHVISDRPDILVYALDDGELTQVPNVYGEDVNTVLTKVFDVPIRDPKAQADFDKVAELIYQKNFESAENYIIKLEKQMPENLELLRCRLHLTQAQLAEKKEG
ncbi:AAA family ATPase [Psychrobacter sp. PAMC 21119]|uniref:AAA family ATPase n=1 Tax=Psychrobacter sp. PAMC 21119 TaxID=1112209 RepID=UPI000288B4AB|nr:AAA family ATPase [Psychrobacter sp. PAMC 21119]